MRQVSVANRWVRCVSLHSSAGEMHRAITVFFILRKKNSFKQSFHRVCEDNLKLQVRVGKLQDVDKLVLSQQVSRVLPSRGRKKEDPVERGCTYLSCRKRPQVKCEFSDSKKLAKKLQQWKQVLFVANSLPTSLSTMDFILFTITCYELLPFYIGCVKEIVIFIIR